jgi:predicted RNA-binding protein
MNILYANVTPTHEGVLLIDILGENKDMVLKDLHEKGVEVTHVN